MTKYNILIVEDESIPAHYLKKMLEQDGHNIVGIADSKESALKYFHRKTVPDLVLMDIKIKGDKDGIQTARIIQLDSNCAVLFISAYTDETFLQRAKDINSIGYLVKPIQPHTLLSTIEIGMSQFKQSVQKIFITLCDEIIFNVLEQTLKKDRTIVDLSHAETLILTTLIENQNALITPEQLESVLCQIEPLSKGALRTIIWRLRKKLPKCFAIENIYNSGYKIRF